MKLAIVHDYLNQYGGAERVIEALNEIYKDSPIYTSIYDAERMPATFRKMDIRTSFMQKIPFIKKIFKYCLFLYPKAFQSFDLSGYDIILSSSSAFAKGIKKDKNVLHICYCYTPARFLWDYENYIKKEKKGFLIKFILPLILKRLKKWDLKNNEGVDYFISISENIKNRIKSVYGLESDVIYPPVNINHYNINNSEDGYFLIVSRLNSYKNLDLVIKCFNKLSNLKLKIVGTGPFQNKLKLMAGSNTEFVGRVDEDELVRLYSRCRAFIFPGNEDFGITPIEAQASGKPVIAFKMGGALETIIDKKTGIFFDENTEESFLGAINRFLEVEKMFDKEEIRKNAERFDKEIFKKKINEYVLSKYEDFKKIKNG